MPMMDVGHVRMVMYQGRMSVEMRVRLLRKPALMFVPVVRAMHMYMVMFDLFMSMQVVMMFSNQEEDSSCHEQ